MVWSSNCSTVAAMAHAVIMARWGTSYWTDSPGMMATFASSEVWDRRMRARGGGRQRGSGVLVVGRHGSDGLTLVGVPDEADAKRDLIAEFPPVRAGSRWRVS